MAFGSAGGGVYTNKKTVAAARQRLDKPRCLSIVTQRLPNLADTEIQALFEIDEGVRPDAFTDVGARQNFSAAANQQFQNPEWLWRQLDAVASPSQFAGRGVQLEHVESQDRGRITHGKLISLSCRAHCTAEVSVVIKGDISVTQDSSGR